MPCAFAWSYASASRRRSIGRLAAGWRDTPASPGRPSTSWRSPWRLSSSCVSNPTSRWSRPNRPPPDPNPDVDAAPLLAGPSDASGNRALFADVELTWERRRPEPPRRRFRSRLISPRDHHPGAGVGERGAHGRAQPAGGAGHQNAGALQVDLVRRGVSLRGRRERGAGPAGPPPRATVMRPVVLGFRPNPSPDPP